MDPTDAVVIGLAVVGGYCLWRRTMQRQFGRYDARGQSSAHYGPLFSRAQPHRTQADTGWEFDKRRAHFMGFRQDPLRHAMYVYSLPNGTTLNTYGPMEERR